MNIEVHSSMDAIPVAEWNALISGNYPFLQHAFLRALEKFSCVGAHVGWIPRHLVYSKNNQIMGAMPLYEKHNSWGEFVFDHAWADAYQRYGVEYYPKLVNAIPFTPASGQRILLNSENDKETARLLVAAVNTLVNEGNYSGIHSLFPATKDFAILNQQQAISRNDCQFHWYNQGYTCFEDFLGRLKSKKRKNIKQERRKVADAGVKIRRLDGHTASADDWHDFTALYQKIYDRKYGMPAFNQAFFMEVARAMPDQIQLVLAARDRHCVAGALMYCDDATLYGRHWGAEHYIDSLHFEVCYYQGIELCIEKGLQRFDPGAQGEHKIARGFAPTRTQSLHWMAQSPFTRAIAQFVEREQSGVQRYIDAVSAHSPYNRDD
ncbi:GNAT family N-acetyltransferase [Candidatus Spongiihabitans sp.]|uniref:GNAT family N-acetyltransferase n=1 Tax=Candidatus Spongiihabitans sp. TaxID=3101308 RepID=UPI003C79DCF0